MPTVCSVAVTMPMAMMPKHTLIIPIYWWEIRAPSALGVAVNHFTALEPVC